MTSQTKHTNNSSSERTMACEEDPYVYVDEDGYTSDEEDISESLVSEIVEEAFRTEQFEGNKNPPSQGMLYPSDSDLQSLAFEKRRLISDECLPMIKITGITDDVNVEQLDAGTLPVSSILNLNEMTENIPRCTVSDGFLPEKTVRFTPTTPSASNGDKKKYPTTPAKYLDRNLGPSLSPLKTQPNESSSAAEDEVSRITSMNCFPDSPCDMSPHNPSPCSPASLTGHMKDADAHLISLEEDLNNLTSVLTHLETKLHRQLPEQEASDTRRPENNKDRVQLEQVLQQALDVLDEVNLKWNVHKRHLDDLIYDSQRLEGGYFMLGNRVKEQNDLILKLKEERRALEEFLQDKEYEWFMVKKSLRADSSFIKGLVKEAKHCRDGDTLWKILDSFLVIHFDREKAIALDSAKQNKINELRLLLCRQQLHLAEVDERNRELEWEMRHQAGLAPMSDCNSSCLKDVLYCDHSSYSPLCSTNPEFASLQILRIGGPHSDLVYERKQLVNAARLFLKRDREGSAEDLSEYDRNLLNELTAHGPGSKDFRLE